MAIDLVMPKLGLTMTEGLIQEWVQKPGEPFSAGAVLLVVETEKIANEVEAVADGVLDAILVDVGETVACGQPIAKWSPKDAAAVASARAASAAEPSPVTVTAGATASAKPMASPNSAASRAERTDGERVISTPYARKLARKLGVDLAAVTGSGPRGRIKGPDVEAAAGAAASTGTSTRTSTSTTTRTSTSTSTGTTTRTTAEVGTSVGAGTRRAATNFEKATAEKLTIAKQVPHFYLASEVEITALEALRKQLNALEGKTKISVTHLLLAALARTLSDVPRANEVYEAGEIVRHATIDIGVAVSTERGLLAPVVRDIGDARIHEIADKTRDLVQRARSQKLRPDDFGGGATSLSNAGMHDVTYMTSIITPGHSSIFGIGSVREVFRPGPKGEPVLKRELGVVMSADHRVHDGVGGLAVLNRFKFYLENPLQIVV